MEIKDLRKGKKVYNVENNQVVFYTYLCVHPMDRNYLIFIDMHEDPFRIWKINLQAILDKNLNTYDEAKLYLADKLEKRVSLLRTKSE